MLSMKVQNAMAEFSQVDVLLEMMLKNLTNVPIIERNKDWYEKVDNSLYLLESTYKAKKANLTTALGGGADNA